MASPVKLERIRNLGIIAHIDAGKTTTTERILYYTGSSHSMGTVDDGNTVTDWMEQERERGITITSATISCTWRDHQLNLIDTPGHVDFTAEVERALRVLDGAVVVLDAEAGVEPQSETVWNQARRYHVPRFVVVNKMDKLGANFEATVEDVEAKLGTRALPIQWPIGAEDRFVGVVDLLRNRALVWDGEGLGAEFREEDVPEEVQDLAGVARETLLEAVCAEDEALLDRYASGEEIGADDLRPVLRRMVLAGQVTPVLAAAALRNRGVQPILDAVVDYLPAPHEVPPAKAVERGGEEVRLPADPGARLAALVFKTYTDADRRRINYVRVYSGTLSAGDRIRNASRDENERVARLYRMQADRPGALDEIRAGDIGVAIGLKHARTGDTLTDVGKELLLEGMTFPEPVVSSSLETKTSADEEKVENALSLLAMDDPTFRVKMDENTGQRIISGMGELHLDVIASRLLREFRLEVRLGKPQVEYRETITRPGRAEGLYDRMMGGRAHWARVVVELTPLAPGSPNALRIDEAVVLPPAFRQAVEASGLGALDAGVVGGYQVIGVEARVVEAELSEEHSTELAFGAATRNAVKDAMVAGEPVLLEPIMRLEIVGPKDFTGSILQGLQTRHGKVEHTELRGEHQTIRARVPLSEMFGYTTELRSATQGRASYSMQFDRFDRV